MHNKELDRNVGTKLNLSTKWAEHRGKGDKVKLTPSSQPDPMQQVTCKLGDDSCASAHASTLNRATAGRPDLSAKSLLQLQRQYGNRYVQRVIALAKRAEKGPEATPETEQAIQQSRGGGQALDSNVRVQMESTFGADFSNVRVHTGTGADALNRSLHARAFTTGQEVFFSQGAYNPGSASGRELVAHELTHVVQQDGDKIRRELTVGQPGDIYEQEADQVARTIIQQEGQPIQKVTDEKLVQRQIDEEKKEEEPLQAKIDGSHVQRQGPEEEKKKEVTQ